MRDPKLQSLAISALFLLLSLPRFAVPAGFIFDEGFYVPAAFELLHGQALLNREHPMLGKELIALSMALFGDNQLGWRLPSLLMMPAALFLSMRALWHYTRDNTATLLFGVLFATSCLTLVLARVATIDAPMIFFTALGAFALSRREDNAAAVAFGLSLACKWTIAPLLPVLAFMLFWHRERTLHGFVKEFARFGFIPLAVYAFTFLPAFFVAHKPLEIGEFLTLQLRMRDALMAYDGPSAYPAHWWELPFGLAPYWGLAAPVEGAWRFVMLMVNPATALLVIGAVLLSWRDKRALRLLPFYIVPLLLAAISERLSFTHQYALGLIIGLAIAAILLAQLRERWIALIILPIAGCFIFFQPFMTAAPFPDRAAGQKAVWLARWQFVDFPAWAKIHRKDWIGKRELQRVCLENPRNCDISSLKSPLGQIMARHGFTAASLAWGNAAESPRLRAINSATDRAFPYYSLSKPITAAVVRKALDLDQRVAGASVRQLLMHTGGWDRAIAGDPVTDISDGRDCTLLTPGPRQFAPGARYAYSNLGYCLLGHAVAEETGRSYPEETRRLLPETQRMGYDPALGPAGGWSGTAAQYYAFAQRPLPDLPDGIVRDKGLPYSYGWATDGTVATHFGALRQGFAVVVKRGRFAGVALFDGRPPDDYAAEAEIRAYLLSLDRR